VEDIHSHPMMINGHIDGPQTNDHSRAIMINGRIMGPQKVSPRSSRSLITSGRVRFLVLSLFLFFSY
jgi:hypothetical protein